MTPKEKQLSPKEVKELVALNEQLAARVKELEAKLEASEKSVAHMQAAPTPAQPSKSRIQAEKALELLRQGPVTTAQLKAVNEKYPSDCIYFVRNVLKVRVKTNRTAEGTTYSLETPTTDDPTA